MIPIDIQVSRPKVKVKGQTYYLGEGGISVLQTSIFYLRIGDKEVGNIIWKF